MSERNKRAKQDPSTFFGKTSTLKLTQDVGRPLSKQNFEGIHHHVKPIKDGFRVLLGGGKGFSCKLEPKPEGNTRLHILGNKLDPKDKTTVKELEELIENLGSKDNPKMEPTPAARGGLGLVVMAAESLIDALKGDTPDLAQTATHTPTPTPLG